MTERVAIDKDRASQLRNEIRAEVVSIEPLDEVEQSHVEDVLAWIDSTEELCRLQKPATPPKHLVSYFVVVDRDHVLLCDHKTAQCWLPTGGHVEPGEHPRDTVARELREELGTELEHPLTSPLMLTCTVTGGLTAGHTDVSLWYVVNGSRTAALDFDTHEFWAVRWFSFEEARAVRGDPHLGRFLNKLSRGPKV